MPTAVPLTQLVDLALGTPEVGAVNFNILHTLLHAMLTKLGIEEVKAEVNDHDREFLSSIILKPHARDPFSHGKGTPAGLKDRSETSSKEAVETTGADRDSSSIPARVGSAGAWDKDSAKGDDSLLDDVSEISYVPSKASTYHRLEQRVAELSKVLSDLNALPTTNELMAELKGKPASDKPVAEMWQTMQLKKRVDANEEGVGKLMHMIEDLMKELEEQRAENRRLSEQVKDALKIDGDDVMKRLGALEKDTETLRKDLDDGLAQLKNLADLIVTFPTPEEFAQFVRWGDLEDALKGLRTELEKLNQPMERIVNVIEVSMQTDPKPESRPVSAASRTSARPSSSKSGPSEELLDILETLGSISSNHQQLEKRVTELESKVAQLANQPTPTPQPAAQPERVYSPPEKVYSPDPEIRVYVGTPLVEDSDKAMKNKVDKGDLENLGNTDELLNELRRLREDMKGLQDTVAKLQEMAGVDTELRAQMDELFKKIQEDAEALKRLQQMLSLLEAAIDKLNKTTQELTEDGRNKANKIQELFGLCDGLERKKADKEYVAMEVDVKADKKQLEGKVNHHLFDSTTAEMNKTIRDILDRLSGTGDDWKNMLAKLTNDLDGKLDRLELNPLKDWLEKKLKALSKKIEAGNLQWTEDEAAGLKKQLIQHYHCLSCDKPVNIMPTGIQPALPANYGMPPSRSPRPYTTYELDQIRQHAKRELWEVTHFGAPDQADFYATSRQCGGSHTVTLPHQRFSKFNTFNQLFREEEPEEVIPIHREEVDVMGADGHIYRGRVERLEAKMPVKMMRSASAANRQNNAQTHSPRPASARGPSARAADMRPGSGQGSRPQSARFPQRSDLAEQRSGATTPQVDEAPLEESGEGEINVEVPLQVPPVQGE